MARRAAAGNLGAARHATGACVASRAQLASAAHVALAAVALQPSSAALWRSSAAAYVLGVALKKAETR
jgi:hypothetical protein